MILMVLSMLKTLVFKNSGKKSLMSPEKYKDEREKRLGKQRWLVIKNKTIVWFCINKTNILKIHLQIGLKFSKLGKQGEG